MDRINNELSEIGYAIQKLASGAHLASKPTWEQIANHIAHNRFPHQGLQINGNAIGRAARRIIEAQSPGAMQRQNDVWATLPGRPSLIIGFGRSSSGSEMRETYQLFFDNPEIRVKGLLSPSDYMEGLVVTGSPSRLHPYVKIQEHTLPGGPTTLRDYPGNVIPSSAEDHRKSVVMRVLRRIGL